ncbi:nucleoside 2-deoxyribosyltransferase (plasmid) [Azospirillum brasilense]|uniref:Nucleoside 2-deoxyribosyltransferase n=1 Tax=Azospirillum brasilense TaxID=192 RepID=A0A4D8R3G4_AZOBR|nr:nucleoside 2-deoxyribosyltransferase [Azospirillum brasilense]
MIVAGGIYRERCVLPHWDQLFGSGLRAAAAVGRLSPGTKLFAYCPSAWKPDVQTSAGSFQVHFEPQASAQAITFDWFHPFSEPSVTVEADGGADGAEDVCLPGEQAVPGAFHVRGEAVVRFGFRECRSWRRDDLATGAVVVAKRAVYDPQRATEPFRANGSHADELAIVVNEPELFANSGTAGNLKEAVQVLMDRDDAAVVVVRSGIGGGTVHLRDGQDFVIPAYRSEKVFRIGVGDVFTALFALHWAEREASPEDAAALASLAASEYSSTRSLPVDPSLDGRSLPILETDRGLGDVYLAAGTMGTGQRWLVEECRQALSNLGVTVFSPFLHLPLGKEGRADYMIEAMKASAAVLVLADDGGSATEFEAGVAATLNKPMVVLTAPDRAPSFRWDKCKVVDDLSSAIMNAAWEALS